MREILFRGKRVDNGEWVYGWYCGKVCADFWARAKESAQIIDKEDLFWHEVIPETVGQYTGLTDKNGIMIFEGDILRGTFSNWMGENEIATAILEDMTDLEMMLDIDHSHEIEVIGNIHDKMNGE